MLSGSTNEQKIWTYLMSKIGNAFGVAGLMGNLYAESGLIPNRVEVLCLKRLKENGKVYDDASYTAAVDSGTITRSEFLNPLPGKQYGYGLAQWTSPGRKGNLYDFVKKKGASIGDLETQLAFLIQELQGSYQSVWSTLKAAITVKAASDVVLTKFECPADCGSVVKTARTKTGQGYYDKYGKTEKTGKGSGSVSLISNCGHDENNAYHGGAAGDQTGGEWALIPWYSRPWSCVLRHPDATVRQLHADMAEAAAQNDKIGYDQYQRDTFGVQLKAAGDDPAKITVKCETDCSKGIIDITKAIGRKTGRKELQNITATYTGNMRAAYRTAGYQVLTESKYLTGPDYLLPGDILLYDAAHVATNIQKGSKAAASAGGSTGNAGNGSSVGNTGTADNNGGSSKGYLSKGDTGTAVKTMQTMLIACGYSCGSSGADGDFGANTEAALKKFQKAAGLTVDGYYGSASKVALEAAYKKATAEGSSSKTSASASTQTTSAGTLNKTPKCVGKVTADNVDVRNWPGSSQSISSWPKLGKGNLIDVCDSLQDTSGNDWYYVRISGKYFGFVLAKYVKKQK